MSPRRPSRHDPPSGIGFCRARLEEVLAEPGPACAAFDVDNTLVDTRYRTAAAVRAFASRQPPARARALTQVTAQDVGYDGRQTARLLGLDPRTAGELASYWECYFWTPHSFTHDRPIQITSQIARRTSEAGVEVFYVTGRIQELKAATIAQLRRLGLPHADEEHVFCKSGLDVLTGVFKDEAVGSLVRRGLTIAWFMTDSRADVEAVRRRAGVPCVLIDFPVRPDQPLPRPDRRVPTIRVR
jgi:phosphoglycolate phosphatase-like HAD superfamily hydrolase